MKDAVDVGTIEQALPGLEDLILPEILPRLGRVAEFVYAMRVLSFAHALLWQTTVATEDERPWFR